MDWEVLEDLEITLVVSIFVHMFHNSTGLTHTLLCLDTGTVCRSADDVRRTQYHSLMRHNKTYAYAMCEFHSHLIAVRTNSFVKVVDPCIRFSWITKHWTSDVETAKSDILNKVGVSTFVLFI